MTNFFVLCTRKVVEALVIELEGVPKPDLQERLSGFLIGQHRVMLSVYRIGFVFLAYVLDISTICMTGRRFVRLPADRRITIIHRWLHGPFSLGRQFMSWMLAMTMLGYEDQDTTLVRLGVDIRKYRRMISLYHSEACYD